MKIKCKAGHQGKSDVMRERSERSMKSEKPVAKKKAPKKSAGGVPKMAMGGMFQNAMNSAKGLASGIANRMPGMGRQAPPAMPQGPGGDISLQLSRAAYNPNAEANIGGYQLDPTLSNRKTRTYHNPETKQTYISHRGTDPSHLGDLKNDFLIATGLLNSNTSKRVRNAENIAQQAQAKYGNNITNVGHSLGGTMAETIGQKLRPENSKVVGYNPGMSPLDVGKGLYNKAYTYFNPNSAKTQKLQNVTRHATGVDPISMGGLLHAGQTVMHKPTSINPHGLSNFKKGGLVKFKKPRGKK